MMKFRQVKAALRDLLGDNAAGRYQVAGFLRQSKSSYETRDDYRFVQVYFSSGNFRKSSNKMRGAKEFDIEININLTASSEAQIDTSVLDDQNATAEEKAAAMESLKNSGTFIEAAERADDSLDELADIIYQIIMDARNENIGLEKGIIKSRFIESINKDDAIIERGDLVSKTGNMKYTCRVQEEVLGEIGNEPDPAILDISAPVNITEGTGTIIENS